MQNGYPRTSFEIIKFVILDCKGCLRCSLRFIAESEKFYYYEPKQHSSVRKLIEQAADFTEDYVCSICLGLLQEQLLNDALIKQVATELKSSTHEFDDFRCNLSLPVSLLLREKSMFLVLQEKFSDYSSMCYSDIISAKDVWKWMITPKLAETINSSVSLKSDFEIGLHWLVPEPLRDECSFLLKACPHVFKKQLAKNVERLSRVSVGEALNELSLDVLRRYTCCPLETSTSPLQLDHISFTHSPIYLAGRYTKHCRELSQTPWFVDGKRAADSSVQELLVQPLLELIKPSDHTFSASGREDVDVLMLGSGRPFAVELVNPTKVKLSADTLLTLQQTVNAATDRVQMKNLTLIDRADMIGLKQGEEEKRKHYRALCWSAEPLTQAQLYSLQQYKDLVLSQKTPIRVLHRRSVLVRERTVHNLRAEKLDNDHHFNLYISTQAGTYVKEFVHGDFCRTQPNLCSLLEVECDILQLDVQDVDLVWPPEKYTNKITADSTDTNNSPDSSSTVPNTDSNNTSNDVPGDIS